MNSAASHDLEKKAVHYGLCLHRDLLEFPFVIKREKKLPYNYARQKKVLPLKEDEGVLLVAFVDPYDFTVQREIEVLLNQEIKVCLTTLEALEKAIQVCYKVDEVDRLLDDVKEGSKLEIDDEDLLDRTDSAAISFLNLIFVEALEMGASDIHFEPKEHSFCVRYRIDGVLTMGHTPPQDLQNQLITRIKVMAKLDIAEHRLPQDGRMKLRLGERQVDCRVSSIPTVYGERIVLRILDRSNVIVGLDQLCITPEILQKLRSAMRQTQGIILVTGPTGSGKTTTLYSAISEMNHQETNIMTIEDPVEFKLAGLSQINVNTKIDLTFASGLRHILRQDPDVIMVGEIRDQLTAEIAIQSALTGHLVLSTLHTNDAPSAITRLVDMGIERFLISSSVIGVMAQRLVRKICPACRYFYEPTEEEKKDFADMKAPSIPKILYAGKGCKDCYGTGYKGRIGVYQWMKMTPEIQEELSKNPDATKLRQVALRQGTKTLLESAFDLVLEGVTTLPEALRVVCSLEV